MIKSDSIILRTVRKEDLEEVFDLMSCVSEKGEFWPVAIPSKPKVESRFNENGFWSEDNGEMLITDLEGKIVGMIGFFKGLGYQNGYEIAYQIFKKEYRGKGYMTEALRIFTSYLFELKPIIRLQVNLAKGNLGSRAVAEKCGYKYEGTMRKVMFNRGVYSDLELFSILREESPTLLDVLNIKQ